MKRFYADAETTGTDPKRNGLIQFSAIITIDGVEVDRIDLKIQPFAEDEIEDTALEVNGLTREELFSEDRLLPAEALDAIKKFMAPHCDQFNKTDKFMWFGFKAAFDADFTREFFLKNGDNYFGSWFFTPPLCVMMLAGYLLQKRRAELENFKLRTVYNYLFPHMMNAYTEEQWHDALFDIERTIDVEGELRQIVVSGLRRSR